MTSRVPNKTVRFLGETLWPAVIVARYKSTALVGAAVSVDQTGACIVVCNGNVFGPFHEWNEEATADLHTHGAVPLVDMVRLLNWSCKGGIKVNVPSSRFDETVELEMKGNLSAMLKKLKLEHVR